MLFNKAENLMKHDLFWRATGRTTAMVWQEQLEDGE